MSIKAFSMPSCTIESKLFISSILSTENLKLYVVFDIIVFISRFNYVIAQAVKMILPRFLGVFLIHMFLHRKQKY